MRATRALLVPLFAFLLVAAVPSVARAGYTGSLAVSVDGLTVSVVASATPTPNNYRFWWGDGTRRVWDPANTATHTYPAPGTYRIVLDVAADGVKTLGVASQTVTVGDAPAPEPDPDPAPEPTSGLPYGAGSFFQSDTAGLPVDAAATLSFRQFMATQAEQKAVTWPKVNLNAGWSGHNHVGAATDPIWKLAAGSGGGNTRLGIVQTQGVHLADSVWDTVPTGTQDRLLVVIDPVFGYTVQCADVAPNLAARTWTASNCGIFWHSSNGLDYRDPQSDDQRNFSSRGRIPDAMQIPRSELDAAVAAGTGVGHVMHIFFVETDTAVGHVHPMVGHESSKAGWGAEGVRIGIDPAVDLVGRGLTGHALALARTLQQNGGYLGDNSGGATQLKVGPPADYAGTNLATDVFKGRISWSDFVVYQAGSQ